MTTTDTDALAERIAAALTEHWRAKHTATGTPCSGCTAAVLPIVAVEVRKAKAEALREAAQEFALSPFISYSGQRVQERLHSRADRIEAGDSDEHR